MYQVQATDEFKDIAFRELVSSNTLNIASLDSISVSASDVQEILCVFEEVDESAHPDLDGFDDILGSLLIDDKDPDSQEPPTHAESLDERQAGESEPFNDTFYHETLIVNQPERNVKLR